MPTHKLLPIEWNNVDLGINEKLMKGEFSNYVDLLKITDSCDFPNILKLPCHNKLNNTK